MLQKSIQKYQNRSLDTAEQANMVKGLRKSQCRGEKLHLSEEELAFTTCQK